MEQQKKPRIDLWQDEFHQRVINNKKKDTRLQHRDWKQKHKNDDIKDLLLDLDGD